MHELTLATSLVDLASEHARRNGATRVTGISIRLGVLCGMGRSLYFCFKPAARNTPCAEAVLTIYEVPLTVQCPQCHEPKTPRGPYNFRCPDCGCPTPKVLTGREMELISIEIDGVADEQPQDAGSSPLTEHSNRRQQPMGTAQ